MLTCLGMHSGPYSVCVCDFFLLLPLLFLSSAPLAPILHPLRLARRLNRGHIRGGGAGPPPAAHAYGFLVYVRVSLSRSKSWCEDYYCCCEFRRRWTHTSTTTGTALLKRDTPCLCSVLHLGHLGRGVGRESLQRRHGTVRPDSAERFRSLNTAECTRRKETKKTPTTIKTRAKGGAAGGIEGAKGGSAGGLTHAHTHI